MPSKKKRFNARFPPARIKKIMQMDEEVGKVAATVPVMISRVLELFIESLIKHSSETTLSRHAKTLSASHLKQTIESQERFHFLRELVSNIPDHQAEDEGPSGFHNSKEDGGSNSNPGRKGRGRPRKPKDGSAVVHKREKRKRKKETSGSSDSENTEDTEDADEGTDEEAASSSVITTASATITSTSSINTATSIPSSSINSDSDGRTFVEAEPSLASATTTTLTKPPPLSELLAQSQQVLSQSQHEEDQQEGHLHDGSVPAPSASTFQAPAMLPAAMPMYQSMPGVASPHLYNWPAHAAALPGMVAAGFPPMTAQGSTVTSMPPQNAGFPGIAVGFPGVPVAMAGFPGLHVPAAGFPGLPGVRPGFSDLGGARPGFLGMTSKAPAVAGASSAAQADDDYDS